MDISNTSPPTDMDISQQSDSYLSNQDPMVSTSHNPYLFPINTLSVNIFNKDINLHVLKPYVFIPSLYQQFPTIMDPPDRKKFADNLNVVKNEMYQIHSLVVWMVNHIPMQCSSKMFSAYNRNWNCCGFFAPMLYFVHYVQQNPQNTFDLNKIHMYYPIPNTQPNKAIDLSKPVKQYPGGARNTIKPILNLESIVNYSRLFYKAVSGYNDFDEENPKSWNSECRDWHNFYWNHKNGSLKLKVGRDYLFNFVSRETFTNSTECETFHHMHVFRVNEEYVIVSDSWAWKCIEGFTSRYPIIRAMHYKDFKYVIECINNEQDITTLNHAVAILFFVPFGKLKSLVFERLVYCVPMDNGVLFNIMRNIISHTGVRNTLINLGGKTRHGKSNKRQHAKKNRKSRKNKKQ